MTTTVEEESPPPMQSPLISPRVCTQNKMTRCKSQGRKNIRCSPERRLFSKLLLKWTHSLQLPENEEKSSVCERGKRRLKAECGNSSLFKEIRIFGPEILKEYNNTKHSSIKMTPTEASKKKNQGIMHYNLYSDREQLSSKPKFKIGDKVRLSNYKRKVFDKGTRLIGQKKFSKLTAGFSIRIRSPINWTEDLNGEEITGSLYEPELSVECCARCVQDREGSQKRL